MKKLFLIVFGITCFSGSLKAQFQQGTRHWGTTINFNGDNSTMKPQFGEYKTRNFYINPSVQTGWMFADNKMFGVRLGAGLTRYKAKNIVPGDEGEYVSNALTATVSPFLRHYKSISPKWALFLHTGLDLAYTRLTQNGAFEKVHADGYGTQLFVVPGISFAVTPRFSIESDINLLSLGLGYNWNDDGKSVNFNAGISSSLTQSFGIRAAWYLTKN